MKKYSSNTYSTNNKNSNPQITNNVSQLTNNNLIFNQNFNKKSNFDLDNNDMHQIIEHDSNSINQQLYNNKCNNLVLSEKEYVNVKLEFRNEIVKSSIKGILAQLYDNSWKIFTCSSMPNTFDLCIMFLETQCDSLPHLQLYYTLDCNAFILINELISNYSSDKDLIIRHYLLENSDKWVNFQSIYPINYVPLYLINPFTIPKDPTCLNDPTSVFQNMIVQEAELLDCSACECSANLI